MRDAFATAGWMLKHWPTFISITYQLVVAVQNLGIYFHSNNTTKRTAAGNALSRLINERFILPHGIEVRLDAIINFAIELCVSVAKRLLRHDWTYDPEPLRVLVGKSDDSPPTIATAAVLIDNGHLPVATLKAEPDYLRIALDEFRQIEIKNAVAASGSNLDKEW